MSEILFQPQSISTLALLILNGVVAGYMLTIRNKSTATRWLITAFLGFALFELSLLLLSSFMPLRYMQSVVLNMLNIVGFLGAIWALIHFSYRFLENPFPQEAFYVLIISSVLSIAFAGYSLYAIFYLQSYKISQIYYGLVLLYYLWSVIVLWRKRRRKLKNDGIENSRRTVKAYRAYGLFFLLGIVIIILTAFSRDFGLAQSSIWYTILLTVTSLILFFGLVIVYLNYSPEPITLQAKLIGLSLATVLALLYLTTQVLYPNNSVDSARFEVPEYESINFKLNQSGGYAIKMQLVSFDSTNLGIDLNMGDEGDSVVAIGFSFPFSGQEWDSLYVGPNGTITFGAPIYGSGAAYAIPSYFYSSIPKIIPLYSDFNPASGGAVYLNKQPGQAIITWYNVPTLRRPENTSTFQVVLYENGAIDFNYVDISPSWAKRGIIPAGTASHLNAATYVMQKPPGQINEGEAWVNDWNLRYRKDAHQKIVKLVWLTIASTLFIIIIFPFFFRGSLINPLERLRVGVRRVNEGELDLEIPVDVKDEIGFLTQHFNHMTGSLQKYRDNMQGLVAERTAELEKSLEQLKAAQNQLVQQEKLASLGQLTAGIAHEIKNPLNFVNNFSEVSVELLEEVREELAGTLHATSPHENSIKEIFAILDDVEANLKKIHEHGSRADNIVKSMLQHSRGKSGEKVPTDINTLLDEYVHLAYHGMRATDKSFNLDIQTEFDDAIPKMDLVAQDMSRAFLNIINNGMYAANEYAKETKKQASITIKTKLINQHVEIRVRDSGSGIPDKIREKIFEPFFTTKPTGAGTGLGLSMTFDIIKIHHGTLNVISEDRKFTEFIITLPINTSK